MSATISSNVVLDPSDMDPAYFPRVDQDPFPHSPQHQHQHQHAGSSTTGAAATRATTAFASTATAVFLEWAEEDGVAQRLLRALIITGFLWILYKVIKRRMTTTTAAAGSRKISQ